MDRWTQSNPMLCGQFLAFTTALLSLINSELSELTVDPIYNSVSANETSHSGISSLPPALQTLPVYIVLWLMFTWQQRRCATISAISIENQQRLSRPTALDSESSTNEKWGLFFAAVSLCDVEGNLLVVSSFKYGNLQTLILLQSSTTVFVVILSYLVFKRTYSKVQIFSIATAIVGLGLTVFNESVEKQRVFGTEVVRLV